MDKFKSLFEYMLDLIFEEKKYKTVVIFMVYLLTYNMEIHFLWIVYGPVRRFSC